MNFSKIKRSLFLFTIFFIICLLLIITLEAEVQKNANIQGSNVVGDNGKKTKKTEAPLEVKQASPRDKKSQVAGGKSVGQSETNEDSDGTNAGGAKSRKQGGVVEDSVGNLANLEDIKRASTERFPLKLVVEDEHEWIKGTLEDYLVLSMQTPVLAGQDVKGIQQVLQKLDFYHGKIDGVYGLDTMQAVEDFQKHYGLQPTGVVDLDDYKLIAECYEEIRSEKPKIRPAGQVSLLVILDERLLYVFDNGKYFAKFPVAIGTPLTPTPLGHWTIIAKDSWGEGFGTRWLGLNVPYGRFGIHGTNKPWSISGMESHGCVRMFNEDVEVLYDWVKHGTKVDIIGGQFPYNLPWRVLQDGDRGSDVWQLQMKLKELGYLRANPDGVFGGYTKRALIKFQEDKHLKVTGYLDPATLYALDFELFQ